MSCGTLNSVRPIVDTRWISIYWKNSRFYHPQCLWMLPMTVMQRFVFFCRYYQLGLPFLRELNCFLECCYLNFILFCCGNKMMPSTPIILNKDRCNQPASPEISQDINNGVEGNRHPWGKPHCPTEEERTGMLAVRTHLPLTYNSTYLQHQCKEGPLETHPLWPPSSQSLTPPSPLDPPYSLYSCLWKPPQKPQTAKPPLISHIVRVCSPPFCPSLPHFPQSWDPSIVLFGFLANHRGQIPLIVLSSLNVLSFSCCSNRNQVHRSLSTPLTPMIHWFLNLVAVHCSCPSWWFHSPPYAAETP